MASFLFKFIYSSIGTAQESGLLCQRLRCSLSVPLSTVRSATLRFREFHLSCAVEPDSWKSTALNFAQAERLKRQ